MSQNNPLDPPPQKVKRVLLAGDTHGNYWHMNYLYLKAVTYDVDAIVVLGDFGYWEHSPDGVEFLNEVSRLYRDSSIPTFFIDGNHENHELLRYHYMGVEPDTTEALERVKAFSAFIDNEVMYPVRGVSDEGFCAIREGLWYIPRGTRWVWNGISFLGLGGAYSVDRGSRSLGTSWWKEEVISQEDVDRVRDVVETHGEVDIMLTHDVPWGIDIDSILISQTKRRLSYSEPSTLNRKMLYSAVVYAKPKWVFHGHMHHRYRSYFEIQDRHIVDVIGLSCDNTDAESWLPISLDPKLTEERMI